MLPLKKSLDLPLKGSLQEPQVVLLMQCFLFLLLGTHCLAQSQLFPLSVKLIQLLQVLKIS